MKLLTRFREEFTPESVNAEINRTQKSKAKTKTNSKNSLSRLPKETSVIMPTLKISLR